MLLMVIRDGKSDGFRFRRNRQLTWFYFYEIGSTDLIWNDLFNNFEGNGYLDNFLFFSITMKENFNGPVLSHFMFHCFILLRSEEHTSELQSRGHLVCRLLLEKKKY